MSESNSNSNSEKGMENIGESEKMKGKGIPVHGGKYVQYNVLGNLFEVSSKYAPPLQPVGRGAYGIVWLPTYSLFPFFSAQFRFIFPKQFYLLVAAVQRIRRRKKVLR